jgi:hypothetical protein
VIWAGTDDGNVQITRDGGTNWTNVRGNVPGVPNGLWVSRVTASRYAEGRAYVTFDGHRSDHFRPWVFRTDDFGRSWTSISSNLPGDHPVYVITEDTKNPNLLFVGTEFSVFATVDGGTRWDRLMNGMPTVAVHDLVIHPRDGDLIAATHGRSVWILDDIGPLQQLTPEVVASDAHLFENRIATQWKGISRGATRGHRLFMGRNPLTIEHQPPGNSPRQLVTSATVDFYLGDDVSGPVSIEVTDMAGEKTFSENVDAEAGLNRYFWSMRFDPTDEQRRAREEQIARAQAQGFGGGGGGFGRFGGQLQGDLATPGTYRVTLTVNGTRHQGTVTIREDPGMESR